MNVTMIAPGHDELDNRVLRSQRVLSKLGNIEVNLYLEKNRVTGGFVETSDVKSYESIGVFDLLFLRKLVKNRHLIASSCKSEYVYVHDSGLYGLLLVRYLNKKYKLKNIIFDYHDYLEWEVIHHIKKITKNKRAVKWIYFVVVFLLRRMVLKNLNIEKIVGISEGQIVSLADFLELDLREYFSIPNTRNRIDNRYVVSAETAKSYLLWVGNVGSGRSFEALVSINDELQRKSLVENLVLVGKKWGSANMRLNNLINLGGYKNDADILDKLMGNGGKYVGLFLGWEDEYSTGINEIASPNKLYSFINVGVPFLIPSTLKDFIGLNGIPETLIFENVADIELKIKHILDNYESVLALMGSIKSKAIWDSDLESSVSSVVKSK